MTGKAKEPQSPDDIYPDADERRDAVIRRMLAKPPNASRGKPTVRKAAKPKAKKPAK